jgi:hypothetical protein
MLPANLNGGFTVERSGSRQAARDPKQPIAPGESSHPLVGRPLRVLASRSDEPSPIWKPTHPSSMAMHMMSIEYMSMRVPQRSMLMAMAGVFRGQRHRYCHANPKDGSSTGCGLLPLP